MRNVMQVILWKLLVNPGSYQMQTLAFQHMLNSVVQLLWKTAKSVTSCAPSKVKFQMLPSRNMA